MTSTKNLLAIQENLAELEAAERDFERACRAAQRRRKSELVAGFRRLLWLAYSERRLDYVEIAIVAMLHRHYRIERDLPLRDYWDDEITSSSGSPLPTETRVRFLAEAAAMIDRACLPTRNVRAALRKAAKAVRSVVAADKWRAV